MYRYANSALFVSSGEALSDQTFSGSVIQLSRVQTSEIGVELPTEKFKYLNSRGESAQIAPNLLTLNYTYLPTNGKNERDLGFFTNITGNAFKKLNEAKNYYFTSLENALDYNFYIGNDPAVYNTVGIGNALLDSWSINGAIGSLVTATAAVRGLKGIFYSGVPVNQQNPAVTISNGNLSTGLFSLPVGNDFYTELSPNSSDDVKALTAGDIIMEFPSGSVLGMYISGLNACILQDFNLAVSFPRDENYKLGTLFPDRPIRFPIELRLSAGAIIQKYKAEQLASMNCLGRGHEVNITILQTCSTEEVLKFSLKGLQLEAQQISTSVESNFSRVQFEWSADIYSFGTGGANFSMYASQGTQIYLLDYLNDLTGSFMDQEQIWRLDVRENQF